MKPQTGAFLDKARELLEQANTVIGVGLNEAAGRTAYLAALHAAQALIFENTDKVVSSHKSVQSQFWQLTKDEPRVDDELRAFLSRAYKFKRIADYDTGPAAHITAETARNAIATARRFVDCVAALIPPNAQTPHASDTPKPA
jgi:uncharacterized protein (UPF0332 family)